MSTEVATTTPQSTPGTGLMPAGIVALQATNDEDFKGVAGSRVAFLPRLQLFTSNSEACKVGKIPIAHYGLVVKDEITDMGKEVLCIPLAWRPKAMFVKADPVLAYHKPQSAEFQDIKKKADADSNSGNLYGPEFLLWLGPEKGYVTFFMGSKTARNSAPGVRALLPAADGRMRTGVLTAEFIQTSEYSWHGPKIIVSTQSVEFPPQEGLEQVLSDFLNPKDSEPQEEAPAAAANEAR